MDESYDVVVVGGGTAGLSGAVALGRSLRSVLVVDGGEPRNSAAAHAHNFLTRDGTPPGELLAAGRTEVERYGGTVEPGRVVALARDGAGFRVELAGRTVAARRLLVATGVRDELPDVPGLAERWGVDVLHCPYCHGYEVRGQRIGVLATGPAAGHQATLFRQLSPDVTVFRHTGVRLADGGRVPLDALVVAPLFLANADLLAPLGLAPAEVTMGEHVVATRIEAAPAGATAAAGVWVAGNLAEPMAQLMSSAASGLMAGAMINADLAVEDAALVLTR
jgi:thioredoxin reductase